MHAEESPIRQDFEDTVPFERRDVSGGSQIFISKSARSYGMSVIHGQIIYTADTEEGFQEGAQEVRQEGEWFYVSSAFSPKLVDGKSPQTEAIKDYLGQPHVSTLRQIIEDYRRRRLIKRLPKGLRPNQHK